MIVAQIDRQLEVENNRRSEKVLFRNLRLQRIIRAVDEVLFAPRNFVTFVSSRLQLLQNHFIMPPSVHQPLAVVVLSFSLNLVFPCNLCTQDG